ncbi:LysR family transcriptional regulator [Basfia succiniciproducens]|uniref:LysR family transcriptional regulator n=1 Tax=Basfia succiniciproducens TaxID=653940 RepID=UPI003FCDB472
MNTKNTSVYALKLFLQVLELGSLSEVARRENLSASMLSRLIKQLEDDWGAALFYRNTRAITPTETGLLLAEYARQIVSQFQAAEQAITAQTAEIAGTVRINAPVFFGQLHIIPHLAELQARYPNLIINLVQTDDYIDPFTDSTDIIFRLAPLNDSSLKVRILAQQHFCLAASPSYLQKYGTPKAPADLAKHHALFYKGKTGTLRWLLQEGENWQACSPKIALTSNNGNAIATACVQGMGIALLANWAASDLLKEGKVVRLLPEYNFSTQTVPVYVAMLYPQTAFISPSVRAVLDYFREIFQDKSW